MTKELDGVCWVYCFEVWTEALNVVGGLTDSKWRKAENVYYLEDLQEVPEAISRKLSLL